MACIQSAAYHAIILHGNPLAITLDGSHGSTHSIQDLIKRASNFLDDEEAMTTFLELLAEVLLLKEGMPSSILGFKDYLWFPISSQNQNNTSFSKPFMEAYKGACERLMASTKESNADTATLERESVKSDLSNIYQFMI